MLDRHPATPVVAVVHPIAPVPELKVIGEVPENIAHIVEEATEAVMPREEVETRLYKPEELPIRSCPKVGFVEVPVPPLTGNVTAPKAIVGRSNSDIKSFFILVM